MLVITIGREMREMRQRQPSRGHHAHGVDWIDILGGRGVVRGGGRTLASEPSSRAADDPHWPCDAGARAVSSTTRRTTATPPRRQNQPGKGFTSPEKLFYPSRRHGSISRPDPSRHRSRRGAVEVRTRDGRVRRVDLGDLENAEDVRAAFEAGHMRLAALPEGDPVAATVALSAANQPTPGVYPTLTPSPR